MKHSFYQSAADYLKEKYLIDPSDIGMDKEAAEEAEKNGETPEEYIDQIARKLDLTPVDNFTPSQIRIPALKNAYKELFK
jgi:hypothetical protein